MTCTHRVDRRTVSYSASTTGSAPTGLAAAGSAVTGTATTGHASTGASAKLRAAAPAASTSPALWPIVDETIALYDIELESGQTLDRVDVRYRLEGAINPARDNLVLIIHALTGTPDASNWWSGVIGENEVLSPRTHAILCANLLGGCVGTSGPRTDDTSLFPSFTTRDQALVLARLLNALGVNKPALICGGSLGGMVALEFAASFPERVRQAVVLAAPAAQTAQGLAWHAIMRRAIAVGGENEGLALARMVGMLSYRTAGSFEARFGRDKNEHGVPRINEWLYAHGDRLVNRFDARSYVGLIDAMDEHDVGRHRGGIAAALQPVANRIIGVGIPGDVLFTAESVQEWCEASGAQYRELKSVHGHDAFLLETTRVSAIIHEALVRSALSLAAEAAALSTRLAVNVAATSRIADLNTYRAEAGTSTTTRPLRIALAGCGHVGSALLDLLAEHPLSNGAIEVTGVLVRDLHRDRPSLAHAINSGLSHSASTITDPSRLLDGPVDVLVELIGGTSTAHTLVKTALARGIRVVTANKALLATCGPRLSALAARSNTTLDYEGAVAAAVPVIRCLRSGAAGVGVTKISGILNGTTNVVLEKVSAGESLADAIAFAQREGFAEADPTRDLSGEDAEDKLRVLAWLAFGVDPAALHVERRGIDEATAAWAASAAREGDRVKLIASVYRESERIVARVAPELVRGTESWASVEGPSNRIVIESESAGALVLHGPGAGGRATAGAVYGDIFQAVR